MDSAIPKKVLFGGDAKIWNEFRVKWDSTFSNTLSGLVLENLHWSGHDLSELQFEGCKFSRSSFKNVVLTRSKFVNCLFENVVFLNSTGSFIQIKHSRFDTCQLDKCNLPGIDFSSSSAQRSDFLDIRSHRLFWQYGEIFSCRFERASLPYSMFLGSKFVNTQFVSSVLSGSDFDVGTVGMRNFQDCDLGGVSGLQPIRNSFSGQLELPIS